MTQQKLSEYAKLIVQVGVNLQKGQTLVLSCPVECAFFGRLVAEEAYEAGARDVVMIWGDDALSRMKFLRADDAVFGEVPRYIRTLYEEYATPDTARVAIAATDPENLLGVDPDRIQRNAVAMSTALKKYMDLQIAGEFPWCIASIPTPSWAAKVFPDAPAEEAMEKLWDAILHTVHVSGDGDAVEKWRAHVDELQSRVKKLTAYQFKSLRYKNSLGTDLTLRLPERHTWLGGSEETKTGVPFVANMPTEEVFCMPHKDGANGVVYASMPLVLHGQLIRDIKFTLRDGKIVEATASAGQDVLLGALDADPGARFLGEVALVPYHSPISEQKILYYNTLFDENASCHLAFGKAYVTLEGANDMTPEEQQQRGANDSIVHVDFMIGTPDLSIVGTTADGKEVPVFVDGNFAW